MLPGAEQQLTVVTGDVTDPAALQAAMSECEQLVHLAAVVDVAPPRDEAHKQQMIDTALDGTRMVLGEWGRKNVRHGRASFIF
jgi:nucleoside-diphosphate-sugar epimerase